jgi:hypothetical protein
MASSSLVLFIVAFAAIATSVAAQSSTLAPCDSYGLERGFCLGNRDPAAPDNSCKWCEWQREKTDAAPVFGANVSQYCCISATLSCTQARCESQLSTIAEQQARAPETRELGGYMLVQILALVVIAIALCAVSFTDRKNAQ